MLKLYLKKVFLTAGFFLFYLLLGGMLAFVWYIFFRNLFSEDFTTAAVAILAIPAALTMVYRTRCNCAACKQAFFEKPEEIPPSFPKDFVHTFKSKENIVHTLAFLTLDFLFTVPIGISMNTPFIALIAGAVFFLVIGGAVFSLANTLLWCLVHRRWLRYRQFRTGQTD